LKCRCAYFTGSWRKKREERRLEQLPRVKSICTTIQMGRKIIRIERIIDIVIDNAYHR